MALKPKDDGEDPEVRIRAWIERFGPEVEKLFASARRALRKRFPTANELAYDYADSLVVSYTPGERGIEGIVALSARAEGLSLYLLNGPTLPDPKKLLQGTGKQTRFIPLESSRRLSHPDVAALVDAAEAAAKVPLPPSGKGRVIIQSSTAKRAKRPRSSR